MAPFDPHSCTDSTHPLTTHIAFSIFFSFPTSTLHSSALYSLSSPFSGDLLLDLSPTLILSSALHPQTQAPIPFSLPTPHTLSLTLDNLSSFLLLFTTSPSASALQWLSPSQTKSKTHPFVYTQCQSIHARSIFPCQDTPAARIRYSALLNIPAALSSVMSAAKVRRREPVGVECWNAVMDEVWCGPGRVVEEFVMEQPIPTYLFAFAVGEIGEREVGPRTRVYAEGGEEVLDVAEREFKGTEEMIRVSEGLFGSYEWERFDLLVLPPSFPYGGMENPRMVFLTPTVIKGDGTGAQVYHCYHLSFLSIMRH